MIHCKTCRREKEVAEFTENSKQFKTCNACRVKRKKPASERKRTKITLKMCQDHARTKGGKCLSEAYKSNKTKMLWECSQGHQFSAKFNHIKNNNSWCARCAGLVKPTIQECQEFALSKDGQCLSTEYKNAKSRMKWQCCHGHKWSATFDNIKNGNKWCAHCAGVAKHTLEECQELAKAKGGKCLSEIYKNTNTEMQWECEKKHQWSARFNKIKNNNQWCPQCSAGRSETLCKEIMEIYTGGEFTKIRPEWLDGLELDGYCEELNMAFEYNGVQHYRYVPHFHRNGISDFHAQQKRDQKKYKLCREKGIQLMLIPYQFNCYNPEDLEDYIVEQLELFEF